MKRFLAILMALVMLFSMAACTGGNEGEEGAQTAGNVHTYTTGYDETRFNAPGEFPIFKEKQTLNIMNRGSINVSDYNDNFQTYMMEEALNADIVFDTLPSNEYNTKLNLMIAAGGEELGDIIFGSFSDPMVLSFADNEVIVPITEYMVNTDIAHYSNLAKGRLGYDYYPFITMADGEIYYMPAINEGITQLHPNKFVYFKPWFDELGINADDIYTREDLKAAIKRVVTEDPNGNGIASSADSAEKFISYFMNTFIYSDNNKHYMYVKDGNIGFAFTHDQWKEGLKFLNGMYDEGLISPLCFSQDSNSMKSMMNNRPDTIVFGMTEGIDSIPNDDIRGEQYEYIRPLNSDWNDGKPLATYARGVPNGKLIVSKNMEDPELAVRLGDYMTSEEISIHTRFGEKGVDWLEPDENTIAYYEHLGYPARLIGVLPWNEVTNKHWRQTGPYIREIDIAAGVASFADQKSQREVVSAAGTTLYLGTEPEEYVFKLIYTEEENEIMSNIEVLITYVKEMMVKFIMGVEDIDAKWDSYISQLEAMGMNEMLECANDAYDRVGTPKR